MISIQEKINQLKPYVSGIRFVDNLSVVDVILKDGWVVPKSEFIETTRDTQSLNYYMFFSEDINITIDDLLEFIKETIDINIEKEQKKEYFKVRVEELKKLFRTNSLNELNNLRFVFEDEILDLKADNNENVVDVSLEIKSIQNEDFGVINQELVNDLEVFEPTIEIGHHPIVNDDVEAFNKSMSELDLPKKDKNGKLIIEVEDFYIPNSGVCNHSPDTFCINCMENI
jgi:hypothetical protein